VQLARTDTRLVAYYLDRPVDGDRRRWSSRPRGRDVFAGVHAVRAIDARGGMRWEVRHSC